LTVARLTRTTWPTGRTVATWAGATEALKAGWVPVYVCDGPDFPEGNAQLLRRGGLPFPYPFPGRSDELADWLADNTRRRPVQPMLF